MRAPDSELDRLLRAAATVDQADLAEMPFGFDTRIVASSRTSRLSAMRPDFASLVPRLLALALALSVVASAGAYWQVSKNDALSEPYRNGYAIADNAIETGALQ